MKKPKFEVGDIVYHKNAPDYKYRVYSVDETVRIRRIFSPERYYITANMSLESAELYLAHCPKALFEKELQEIILE